MAEEYPIPSPPGLPLVGNIGDINPEFPLGSLLDLANKYGEIYSLNMAGNKITICSTQALIHELCDEKRFEKVIGATLTQVGNGVHDGLFTAPNDSPNWGAAHRILMPAFGPMSIKGMFPEMHEIASQLALKWARHGSQPIMVTDDFTRLALDTLALCSMNFRFNSYYHDEMHPFISAMGSFLQESGARTRRAPLPSIFYRQANQKYWDDIEILRSTAEDVLKERKSHPTDRKDLLSAMLDGVDSKTGQKLSDGTIIDNLITFLIAGHETTSGLLSFALYQLIGHPDAYRKAQKEVDDVIGTGPITVEHVTKLPYINAVLRETLRLSATIPVISVTAKKEEVLGGKYRMKPGEDIALLLAKSQHDPRVFGDTAGDFVPERMLDENFDRLMKEYPDCWKPFGNGVRACIGRPFAWQEATMVVAMLLQNFNFFYDDPNYKLKIKQSLTIKPKDFFMRAVLRDGLTPTELEHRLAGTQPSIGKQPTSLAARGKATKKDAVPQGKPLSIFYGSNTGTCEAMAQRLAADASSHGFRATVIDPLDAARQNLPKDSPAVLISASYEGQPPDNAGLFCSWVENLKENELKDVTYAVFGCGHHDWSQTFHRIPKLLDTQIEERGGSRLCPLGLADAAQGDMFADFEQWEDEIFWPAVQEKYGVTQEGDGDLLVPSLSVQFTTPRSSTLRQDVKEAIVTSIKDLTTSDKSPKKHMEIQLPSDMTYTAGDYLAVLPLNPRENIHRVLRRFQLAWDTHITIETDRKTTLPTDISLPVTDVLGAYVELAQPATKRNILFLSEAARDEPTKTELRNLATESAEGSRNRASILDLLERFPSVAIPFETFLALLPPMRVRQYSVSSSPLWDPSRVTITYSVLEAPSLANPETQHVGVATSYLASLAPGDKLNVSIRPSHSAFHLPVEPAKTPVICIAAGSGLAPFRGFVQERAAQIGAGRTLAPALLFYGCRSATTDDLYREEFDRWAAMGAVDVRRAYSQAALDKPEASDASGCRHVDDRMWHDREELQELWDKGARVYVCGSRQVGEGVKNVVIRIALDGKSKGEGKTEGKTEEERKASVLQWFDSVRNVRYATDVFD